MKKKMFGRLGAAAVALTLITTAMMSGTLAKYTSSFNGTVEAISAKWEFKANDKTSWDANTTLALGTTTTKGIDGNRIAPGSTGEFDITVNNTGSEVRAEYVIEIAKVKDDKNLLSLLEFSTDGTKWNKITGDQKVEVGKGELPSGATATADDPAVKKVTVQWRWPETTEGIDDTGFANGTVNLGVTVTGTQLVPKAETPGA